MGGKSSKNKKSKDAAPAPLDVLVEGAIVFLTSKASGKLLRVNEGNLDAQGEEGESAQFTVSKKESESGHVVTLQHGEKYVGVTEEKVELSDESSELKVVEGEEGSVSFESVKTAGHYLSVQEDGSVQPGSELGPSTHFTVASAVKQQEAAQEAEDTTEPAKEETGGQEQETNAAGESEEGKEDGEQKEADEPPKQQEGQEEQAPSES